MYYLETQPQTTNSQMCAPKSRPVGSEHDWSGPGHVDMDVNVIDTHVNLTLMSTLLTCKWPSAG